MHDWDYRLDSGGSSYNNEEKLPKFKAGVEGDEDEIAACALGNPQPYFRKAYLGHYADPSHGTTEEPHTGQIHTFARQGLIKTGHHGMVELMGVPRDQLPDWDDIQILTAQLARPPLLEAAPVGTEVIIEPHARKI